MYKKTVSVSPRRLRHAKRRQRRELYVLGLLASAVGCAPASAQTTVSTTLTDKTTLSGTDRLEVTSTGSISTGSDKAVSIATPVAVSITVDNGGSITSEDDAITTKTIDTSVGTINIVNNGTIISTESGQAIDLNDVTSTGVVSTIVNGQSGDIIAENADGVRPGAGATVTNSGLIYADGPDDESHDGIDFQENSGTVVNESTGVISGQRHGITSSVGVDVTNYGTIIGRNGSGVGSDGTGTVINYGTIIGAYNGSGTGDGDGVDIDGAFYVVNYGMIEALGAAGYGNDGLINVSEGAALTGGGTLINEEGATITSVQVGVTICCTANPATFYNYGTVYGTEIGMRETGLVTTYNYGSISSAGVAFNYSEGYDSWLTNAGTIAGGTYGIAAYGSGGTLYIDNSGTISGGTAALHIDTGEAVALTLENGSVIDGPIELIGTLDVITPGAVTLSSAISGTGVLNTSGAGRLTLTGLNSYSGATTVSAGTLQAGAIGAFSPSSAFTVASGATLDANGFSQTLAGLVNAGTIATNVAATTAGSTLSVTGNYVGQGGSLVLNTVLGSDNATTDRLVVGGNLSGSTTLTIHNLGGTGGRTTGDGIEVAAVSGTSAAGALKLTSALSAGAFDYNVFRGGVGADAGNQNWYLRTVGYTPAAQSVLPYASSLVAIADASLPGYEARARASIGNGWWGRFVGQYGIYAPQNSIDDSTGVAYNQNMNLFQAGFDKIATQGRAGRLDMGIYGTIGFSRVDTALTADPVSGAARGNARISTNVYGLGTHVTFTGIHGFYADLVGQANLYSSNLSTVSDQHNHGWTGTINAEAGQSVALGDGWSIAPQAQVSWTHIDLDGFVDDAGNAIDFDGNNIVKGRAGFRLTKQASWTASEGRERDVSVQAAARIMHEFTRGTTVDVAESELNETQMRNWAESALRASYARSGRISFYTEATYARAISGGASHVWRPTVGVQANW